MRGPLVRLVVRLAREKRGLLAELEVLRAFADRVVVQRDQARRDAELLALMARDRGVALEFVRDFHRIVQLPEEVG